MGTSSRPRILCCRKLIDSQHRMRDFLKMSRADAQPGSPPQDAAHRGDRDAGASRGSVATRERGNSERLPLHPKTLNPKIQKPAASANVTLFSYGCRKMGGIRSAKKLANVVNLP
jgi:hypothetical protein